MRIYIGRTEYMLMYGSTYELGTAKKNWDKRNGFRNKCLIDFCDHDFEKITGLKLAPGEIRKVKSIKIEVE